MTRGPSRRGGGAGDRSGGMSMGTDALIIPLHVCQPQQTAPPTAHVTWLVKLGGLDEFEVFVPGGLTVEELERDLELKFPGNPVERLRPWRSGELGHQ